MSLSGIFSALSLKKGKSRRKKGQDTSSSGEEDASSEQSSTLAGRDSKKLKGSKSSIFGISAKQESAGQSHQGRVPVPPDRSERTAWGTAKKDAGTKKAAKQGTGYAGYDLMNPPFQPCCFALVIRVQSSDSRAEKRGALMNAKTAY